MVQETPQKNSPVFQLKASLYTLTTLHLLEPDLSALEQQLSKLRQQAPKFFDSAPVIIDFQRLPNPDSSFNFKELKRILTEQQLVIVGLRHAAENLRESAKNTGFAILPEAMASKNSGAHSRELDKKKPLVEEDIKANSQQQTAAKKVAEESEPESEAPHVTAAASIIINKHVRSGQQIYAKQADLIVIGSVSPGAELIADGNIHVYGSLRGRALAGAQGNQDARIFCQQLEAELVSIAGNYWISEDLKRNKISGAGQIFWLGDHLKFEAL